MTILSPLQAPTAPTGSLFKPGCTRYNHLFTGRWCGQTNGGWRFAA